MKLPYALTDTQRLAINVLGSQQNVILAAPTGTGKTDIPLLSTLVLRKKLGIKNGIAIMTQPLNSIIEGKRNNLIGEVAVLSMSGNLSTSNVGEEDGSCGVSLSCDLRDLMNGKYLAIIG